MTTTYFLVRHAAHDNVGGFLAGRMPGVMLGEAGRAQAGRLGERMRREKFGAIYASPRERVQETAQAIAAATGMGRIETANALDEIDFGHWSGKTFDELNCDPLWLRWNSERSAVTTPGGETIAAVQQRAMELVTRLGVEHAGSAVVLVTHADVIKAVVCHVLELPLDSWSLFEVSPASVTTLVRGEWGAKLLGLNEVIW